MQGQHFFHMIYKFEILLSIFQYMLMYLPAQLPLTQIAKMELSLKQKTVDSIHRKPPTPQQLREHSDSEDPENWFDSSDSQESSQDRTNPQQEEKQSQWSQASTMRLAKDNLTNGCQETQQKFSEVLPLEMHMGELFYNMVKFGLANLSEISHLEENGTVQFFRKKHQIIVRANEKALAEQAMQRLQNFVEDTNVLDLDLINHGLLINLEKSKKMRKQLLQRGIVFLTFRQDESTNKFYTGGRFYIGGKFKNLELKKIYYQIRSLRLYNIRLFRLPNRRSYRLVLGQIFESDSMMKQMKKSGVSMIQVDTSNKSGCINVIMNISTKKDMSENQFNKTIMLGIQKFLVCCFILSSQPYFEKLAVSDHPEIKFIYIKEKHNRGRNISYLFIIAEIETFFNHSKAIRAQLEKVGKWMIGVRFFNNLFPELRCFIFSPLQNYIRKFPKMSAYSLMVLPREREGKKFDWGKTFSLFEALQRGMKKSEAEVKVLSKQK